MVMVPGGENPRPEHHPAYRKVGIRIQRVNPAIEEILHFRSMVSNAEDKRALGSRKPSSRARNAFGSKNFQPHMAILRAGSKIDFDLTPLGKLFR